MFTFFPITQKAIKSTKRLSVFLLALCFTGFFSTEILAQNLPVYAYYHPAQFEDGDEISLSIKVGNINQQAFFVQGIQLKIPYDLFDIDPFSEIEVDAGGPSWFGGDGNYFGNHTIDHENSEIIINLFRSNGVPASGHGYTTTMYGIIVEMEEIYGKQQIEPGEIEVSLMEDVKSNMGVSFILQPEHDRILLQNVGEFPVQEIKLYNLSGQVVAEKAGEVLSISTVGLVPQVYILQVTTQKGSFSEKIQIN